MHYEMFLIVFSGKKYNDGSFEDLFFETLNENKEKLSIKSVEEYDSSLTSLMFKKVCIENDVIDMYFSSISYRVFKVKIEKYPFEVNETLDSLFRSIFDELEPIIYGSLLYLLCKNNKYGFHRISKTLFFEKTEDDNHINLSGLFKKNADLFYRDFYKKPLTDKQTAYLSKLYLTTDLYQEVL